ncbi:DUF3173 family protein [Enterococcus ureilyticus]|nr:DUF3173 family protein [Enterococcus ureilyticus]MBM7687498.1 hypothetical protein [Enterococcus ureilyticus]
MYKNNMVSKVDLEKLGFKKHQATTIIRQAKLKLVNSGVAYYNNKRVGIVPRKIVEEIIGVPLESEE